MRRGIKMKKIADEPEPVVRIPSIVKPIQVAVALLAVEPDIADVAVALEGNVRGIIYRNTPRMLSGLYLCGIASRQSRD